MKITLYVFARHLAIFLISYNKHNIHSLIAGGRLKFFSFFFLFEKLMTQNMNNEKYFCYDLFSNSGLQCAAKEFAIKCSKVFHRLDFNVFNKIYF